MLAYTPCRCYIPVSSCSNLIVLRLSEQIHFKCVALRSPNKERIVQMPEAAKNVKGVLKDFFILIQHFQADFDKIMDDEWLHEQDAPDSGVPSLKR